MSAISRLIAAARAFDPVTPAMCDDAEADLHALRERLRNAEQVIDDGVRAREAGGVFGWTSRSRRSLDARAVFYCALDAYAKTYRRALTAPATPTNAEPE